MVEMKGKTLFLQLLPYVLSVLVFASTVSTAGEQGTIPASKVKPSSAKTLITINEDDWDQLLTGEWMVEFHAPWCPACRALQPEWKTFSGWSSDLGIKVGAVDVTANPGLSGRFLVTALPTIYHVKDGVFRQYKGTRDSNSFVHFVEEKKWQVIEPITSWKSPNSIQMSLVSGLFKISMALRSVHNSLVEDYGIPYWGSYIVFAFATILFGAILGLLIVCIIDLIWPVKPEGAYQPLQNKQGSKKVSGKKSKESDNDDIEDDNIEDDNIDDNIEDDSQDQGSEESENQDTDASGDEEVEDTQKQVLKNDDKKDLRKRKVKTSKE